MSNPNLNPETIIRTVGLRMDHDHLVSLGFTDKFCADWTLSSYESADKTVKINYVLGYLQDMTINSKDYELDIRTDCIGRIESVRYGSYGEADHIYPLTESEKRGNHYA